MLLALALGGAFVSALPSFYMPSQFLPGSLPAVAVSWTAITVLWLALVVRASGSVERSWQLPSQLFRSGVTVGCLAVAVANGLGALFVPFDVRGPAAVASLLEALSYECGIVVLASLAAFAFARSLLRPMLTASPPPKHARDLPIRTRYLISAAASSFATAGVLLAVLIDFEATPPAILLGFLGVAMLLVGFTAIIGWVVGDDAARAVEALTMRVRELAGRADGSGVEVPILSADEIGDLAEALQSLERRVRRDEADAAATSERERIARELHDGAAKAVSALALEAASLRTRSDEFVSRDLGRMEKLARDLSEELRAIVRDLRSRSDDTTFASVLADCVTPHRGARLDIGEGVEEASPLVRYQVTRILTEALRNTETHARASHAVVGIATAGDRLRLRVDDDGVGFGPIDWTALVDDGHFGLVGMRERASLLGGDLRLERSDIGGARIEVDLPLRVTE